VLLADGAGTERLRQYFRRYMAIAAAADVGFIAEAATWRANPVWAAKLGYGRDELSEANRRAIAMLGELRAEYEQLSRAPFVISGCIGPRDDGYSPSTLLEPREPQRYHPGQIATFADTEADMVAALTMTHTGEAIGITRAAQDLGMPVAISFTVETDGRLPSQEPLAEAVRVVDDATDGGPAYYMINCAHPSHFASALDPAQSWVRRIRGIRANASRKSHAELDEATELDVGDRGELAVEYQRLLAACKHVNALGGCCGTDDGHIASIADACLPSPA
jgi:S-methylmethionine-dependent homocysteine/selenocysteine methylase